MRLISPFKDYYDFICYQYGQDPNLVYLRRPFKGDAQYPKIPDEDRGWLDIPRLRKQEPAPPKGRYIRLESEIIVVCHHVFPILSHVEHDRDRDPVLCAPQRIVKREILDEEKHQHILQPDWQGHAELPKAPPPAAMKRILRAVGAPVFTVLRNEWKNFVLDENVPILKDTPIPSVLSPQQIWQELVDVLENVLRDSPDKEPPKSVNNTERIIAAGFDLKTSFRHPIK